MPPLIPGRACVVVSEVSVGCGRFTVSVKFCTAFDPTPLAALKVRLYVPLAPGVPLSVPVPLRLSTNVTPLGRDPLSVQDCFGKPVDVTVSDPAVPTRNVALLALVMAGAWLTVSAKFCTTFEPTPLAAMKVML